MQTVEFKSAERLKMEGFSPSPPQDLPYDDGKPLESEWHRIEMNLLIAPRLVLEKR